MAVGDEDAAHAVAVLQHIGEVGDDGVHAGHRLVREDLAAVDDDDVAAVLIGRHVLADLAHAAQRDHAQRAATGMRAGAGAHRRGLLAHELKRLGNAGLLVLRHGREDAPAAHLRALGARGARRFGGRLFGGRLLRRGLRRRSPGGFGRSLLRHFGRRGLCFRRLVRCLRLRGCCGTAPPGRPHARLERRSALLRGVLTAGRPGVLCGGRFVRRPRRARGLLRRLALLRRGCLAARHRAAGLLRPLRVPGPGLRLIEILLVFVFCHRNILSFFSIKTGMMPAVCPPKRFWPPGLVSRAGASRKHDTTNRAPVFKRFWLYRIVCDTEVIPRQLYLERGREKLRAKIHIVFIIHKKSCRCNPSGQREQFLQILPVRRATVLIFFSHYAMLNGGFLYDF